MLGLLVVVLIRARPSLPTSSRRTRVTTSSSRTCSRTPARRTSWARTRRGTTPSRGCCTAPGHRCSSGCWCPSWRRSWASRWARSRLARRPVRHPVHARGGDLDRHPDLHAAILFVAVWGGGLDKLILYLVIVSWIGLARLARAQVVSLKEREYVLSARALGASDRRLLTYHILPNAAGPLVVGLVMAIPAAIFVEAGLSYLGFGVGYPVPSWGKMITEGGKYA